MAEPKENVLMEKIVSLCKRRGFIYQSSEIYGGINGFWDYGPLGAELKRNVKELWWNSMTRQRDDVVGLEATIIMSPEIWKASGHVDTFADMMRSCLLTSKLVRVDQVEPQSGIAYHFQGAEEPESLADTLDSIGGNEPKNHSRRICNEKFSVLLKAGKPPESAVRLAQEFYRQRGLRDPAPKLGSTEKVEASVDYHPESCAKLSPARPFNLMFKTHYGPVESEDNVAYLRPETAQAIFAQFKNVLETSRQKVPFGIAQIGKAFRNEVTPRNYTFRSREFEQMELEFFIKPDEVVEAISGKVASASEACGSGSESAHSSSSKSQSGLTSAATTNWGWEAWHKYWVEERIAFYEGIGLPRATLVEYWQKPEELAHYARATVDILFKFPFSKRDEKGELMGEELEGIAARSDFDLSQHARFSGKPMGVFDEELRAAWGKLEEVKKKELRDRYYENRKKYLTKTARPEDTPESIEKQATEDASGLAKGQYIPHVIEPSAGVDRLILALICNAYSESSTTDDKGRSETTVTLKFHPRVAPYKAGVFPLLKNKPELVRKAQEVRELLRPWMNVFYDESGSIGRRYARQDEIGTPFCVTIDFDTLGEKPELKDTVTIRHRDDGKQERLAMGELRDWLLARVR